MPVEGVRGEGFSRWEKLGLGIRVTSDGDPDVVQVLRLSDKGSGDEVDVVRHAPLKREREREREREKCELTRRMSAPCESSVR